MTGAVHGRGTGENPKSRFVEISWVPDPDADAAGPADPHDPEPAPATRFYRDASKTILTRNDSPDVGFDWSLNPYRGCEHGCIYCYARPTHEYLGFSAGLDFETRIMVKEDAPELLRAELARPSWQPQVVAMSGVTDCYQPIERTLKLTRRCLEVFRDFGNPVVVITKSALVARDADVLGALAARNAAAVGVTLTSLRDEVASVLEPRAARPRKRLETIAALAQAGIPVTAMVSPVVPGLTDHEIPQLVRAAAEAGATAAGFVVLRLPYGVKDLFEGWLDAHFPAARQKVLHRLESMRGGKLNDPRFGSRMRGEGIFAEQIEALFDVACARAGISRDRAELSTAAFRRPDAPDAPGRHQGRLFG
jgi:DNA repair photolyase